MVGGQEPHAQVVLQKRVHAVERSARPSAGNGDEVVSHDDPQAFRTHGGRVERDGACGQGFARPDEDVPVGAIGS